MADKYLEFKKFLVLAESYGWKLKKIIGNKRIFIKDNKSLPFVIQVQDKKVDVEYVKKFKAFLKERSEI